LFLELSMPFPSITNRFPNGITNADATETLGAAGFPDPTWAFVYANDFDNYVSTDFTTTLVGTGTVAGTDFDGGAILLTTTTGAADAVHLQRRNAQFKVGANRDTFFKFAGQLSDVTNSAFYCGLLPLTTTPLATSDGLFLYKASGAATLVLRSIVGGTTTDTALPANELLVAGSRFEIGFHSDPQGNVEVFFNPGSGLTVQNPAAGDSRGRVAAMYLQGAATLTTALLSPAFGIVNATGAARTLTADFLVAGRHR